MRILTGEILLLISLRSRTFLTTVDISEKNRTKTKFKAEMALDESYKIRSGAAHLFSILHVWKTCFRWCKSGFVACKK